MAESAKMRTGCQLKRGFKLCNIGQPNAWFRTATIIK